MHFPETNVPNVPPDACSVLAVWPTGRCLGTAISGSHQCIRKVCPLSDTTMALTRIVILSFFLWEGYRAIHQHSTPGFNLAETPAPTQVPLSGWRKYTKWVSQQKPVRQDKSSALTSTSQSKLAPWRKKKSHFPLRHYRKAGQGDCHDSSWT